MCGIFATVGTLIGEPDLARVLGMLQHRGPDGRGWFSDPASNVTLAHTRLVVIDPATGAQPMHSGDGDVVLVCNGEIYDFERIRSDLEAKGHRFATKSDSEIIIYLYQEYGLGCLEHLRGEFAFLLYDRAKRLLLAARDRFGIKPLYFSRIENRFVFASEMKAIFASGLVEPKLNAAGLDPIADVEPLAPQFPFEGIGHVPPASYMLIDLETHESRVAAYWSPEIPEASAAFVSEPPDKLAERCAAIVVRELEEAVKLRLRADVPVGLYLSGGVDSAFIGALMQRNLKSPLHSFSISFVGSERNEQEWTRRSAAFLGTAHHELAVTKAALWANLEDCVWSTELPFATLAPVGKFLLSQEARKFVTVVLNGQGADEVFLGYRRFFEDGIRDTSRGRSGWGTSSLRIRRLKLGGFGSWIVSRLSLLLFDKSQRSHVASWRAKRAVKAHSSKPLINWLQEARIAEMPIDILGFLGDRVEMAHSLEVRVPFLDHRLYDAAKVIPPDFKIRCGIEKAVLRDAARGILPDDIRLRRKLGFMLTSEKVDFFGTDGAATENLRSAYLSKDAFERAGVFSYPTYRFARLLARLPGSKRVTPLRRLRRNANKLIMYIMQVHMLHQMYVIDRRWMTDNSAVSRPAGASAPKLA